MIRISIFLLVLLFACKKENKGEISVEWTDELIGDFSFADRWSYGENISRNAFGQLSCDGFCEDKLLTMLEENGKIKPDSLNTYYQLVDTTHYMHSLFSESNAYEWAGSDFAYAYRLENDTVKCYTVCSAATHSSLYLSIVGNKCIPRIELNSIVSPILKYFDAIGGSIILDEKYFEKGILKAEFNIIFNDTEHPSKIITWKGKILTKIENK